MKKYESYKDSGIEWIGEIPSHWMMHRIDWITKIVRGNSAFKKDELLSAGEYVALQYGKTYKVDVVDDGFKYFVNSEFFNESQIVSSGDTILISTSETIEDLGHTCFYSNRSTGLLGGEQILLKPCREVLFEKYLYYYSRQFGTQLRKYAKGLKVFRFNTNDLKQLFLAIPPTKEQTDIANFLDQKTSQIDDLIAKKERLIQLLEEERTALINQAVTKGLDPTVPMKDSGIEWLGEVPAHWEVRRLKNMTRLITNKSTTKTDYTIALENIESWSGRIIGNPFENEMIGDSILFETGDVLFNKLRPYLAKVTLAERAGGAVGELLVLRPQELITSRFLFNRLRSEMIITVVDSSTYGTKMPRASWDKFIGLLEFGVPSLDEQHIINEEIERNEKRIDLMKLNYQKEIDYLLEFKNSLIAEAVTGKIDVRYERI